MSRTELAKTDLRRRFLLIPAEARQFLSRLSHDGSDADVLRDWYLTVVEYTSSQPLDTGPSLPSSNEQSPASHLGLSLTDQTSLSCFCPVCPTSFASSKHLLKHAKEHCFRFCCPSPGCLYSAGRRGHYKKHVRKAHAAEADAYLDQQKTVVHAWVAQSCGICEDLFQVTARDSSPPQHSMVTTFNEYLEHVAQHARDGATRQQWTAITEIRGLLKQVSIASVWNILRMDKFGISWDDQNVLDAATPWIDEVAKRYIKQLQMGASTVNPEEYLSRLLNDMCAHQVTTQQTPQGSVMQLDHSMRDGYWDAYSQLDLEKTPVFAAHDLGSVSAGLATVPARYNDPSILGSHTEFFDPSLTGSTAAGDETFGTIDGITMDQNAYTSSDLTVMPLHANDSIAFSGYSGVSTTGNQPFTELDNVSHLPVSQDLPSMDFPSPDEMSTFLHESMASGVQRPFAAIPESEVQHDLVEPSAATPLHPPYNPTPPLAPVQGKKRPHSGLFHSKRLSGIFSKHR